MSLYLLFQKIWRHIPSNFKNSIRENKIPNGLKKYFHSLIKKTDKHNSIYNDSYFEGVEKYAQESAEVIAKSIIVEFNPQNVIDIGCGTGLLLNEFNKYKIETLGIDYSERALNLCKQKKISVLKLDLEKMPITVDKKYDIVTCMEVAEHLPERIANKLVNELVKLGNIIVFTAAPPGQGDIEHHNHVNEQPKKYWIVLFNQVGFNFDVAVSQKISLKWKNDGVSQFYYNNLMIFKKN
jgi:SAM-dependent methyltransferase